MSHIDGREMHVIDAPCILLPKQGVDLTRFSVIACDQFTSQIEYWNDLKALIGDSPSTYRMIFPEAYLQSVDNDSYIKSINENIETYLNQHVLESAGKCFILVERSTPFVKRRLGLMISIDLEAYTYEKGVRSPIRATEATILSRIPPRLKIREHASIELPHTLLLVDDPIKRIIENLYARRDRFPLLYDFELNSGGGHLRGYQITDTAPVIKSFYSLLDGKSSDLLFVVGDGNHSLATAKAHWDKLKANLTEAQRKTHPARFALVEVINLYDDGLSFEAIHRVIFEAGPDFIPGLEAIAQGDYLTKIHSKAFGIKTIFVPAKAPQAYKLVQTYIDEYLKTHPLASVDYIHGTETLIEIAQKYRNTIAIEMPSLTKGDLFEYIVAEDVLPRKSFSTGHAAEKRSYLESKRIRQ